MPDILLTGINSFIGNNFIKNSKFSNIDSISLIDHGPEKCDFNRFDTLIHLAAIVHQSKKITRNEYFRVNKDLCLSVANKARQEGVKHFIFISTTKVYGEYTSQDMIWDECSLCLPSDYYSQSKYEAEEALKKLETEDFTVSIIRTPIVYGEGVRANMFSLIKLVERYPALPLGGINNLRNYTFAENLVGFIDRIIEKRASGTFIAMDSEPVSTTHLVRMISDALGKQTKLFRLPDILVRTGKYFLPSYFERIFGSVILDNRRTREILDYNPPFSIEQGLRKMISTYMQNK